MSLDLSGNLDLELSRFQLIAEHNLTVDRVNELLPRFDIDAFPTILSPADVCVRSPHSPFSFFFNFLYSALAVVLSVAFEVREVVSWAVTDCP